MMDEFALLKQALSSGGGAGSAMLVLILYNKFKDKRNGSGTRHPITGKAHDRRGDDNHTKLLIAEFEIKINEKFSTFKDDIYEKMSVNKNLILEKFEDRFEKIMEKINDLK